MRYEVKECEIWVHDDCFTISGEAGGQECIS